MKTKSATVHVESTKSFLEVVVLENGSVEITVQVAISKNVVGRKTAVFEPSELSALIDALQNSPTPTVQEK
jgi:hypothetical protein